MLGRRKNYYSTENIIISWKPFSPNRITFTCVSTAIHLATCTTCTTTLCELFPLATDIVCITRRRQVYVYAKWQDMTVYTQVTWFDWTDEKSLHKLQYQNGRTFSYFLQFEIPPFNNFPFFLFPSPTLHSLRVWGILYVLLCWYLCLLCVDYAHGDISTEGNFYFTRQLGMYKCR